MQQLPVLSSNTAVMELTINFAVACPNANHLFNILVCWASFWSKLFLNWLIMIDQNVRYHFWKRTKHRSPILHWSCLDGAVCLRVRSYSSALDSILSTVNRPIYLFAVYVDVFCYPSTVFQIIKAWLLGDMNKLTETLTEGMGFVRWKSQLPSLLVLLTLSYDWLSYLSRSIAGQR